MLIKTLSIASVHQIKLARFKATSLYWMWINANTSHKYFFMDDVILHLYTWVHRLFFLARELTISCNTLRKNLSISLTWMDDYWTLSNLMELDFLTHHFFRFFKLQQYFKTAHPFKNKKQNKTKQKNVCS